MSIALVEDQFSYGSTTWSGFDQAAQLVISSLSGYGTYNINGSEVEIEDYNSTSLPYPPYFHLWLSSAGCWIDGVRNCTAACAEASHVWTGPDWTQTLQNCMLYPLVAVALADDLLVNCTRASNGGYGFDTPCAELAATFGIEANADLDLYSDAPWNAINKCTIAYCQAVSPTREDCAITNKTAYMATWHAGTFQPQLHFNTTLCQGVDNSINQDLGGIGMVIAYLIQITILLVGWLIESFNSNGIAITVWTALIARRPWKTGRHRWRKAKRLQHKARFSQQAVALVAVLVEFQKTQTFFVLAVAVAAILAVNNAAYLQVSSYQMLQNNIGFIATVALSGCYPIVLNLLVLRKSQNVSLFLLGTSACCMAVSLALWILTFLHQSDVNRVSFSNGHSLPECGTTELTNPTWTCSDTYGEALNNFNASVDILIFPFVVMAFLVAEEMKVFNKVPVTKDREKVNVFVWLSQRLRRDYTPLRRRASSALLKADTWASHRVSPRAKYWLDDTGSAMKGWRLWVRWKWQDGMAWVGLRYPKVAASGAVFNRRVFQPAYTWTRTQAICAWEATSHIGLGRIALWMLAALYKVVPGLVELGLVTINAILMNQYIDYLALLGDAGWSLGQVISVTIWVPVVVEYVYLLICGIEGGFEYRLSGPYHVKKDDEEVDDSSSSDHDSDKSGDQGLSGDAMSNHSGKDSMFKSPVDHVLTPVDDTHLGESSRSRMMMTPSRPFTGT